MEHQIRLGRWFGVDIGLHVSWLIIAFLITMSVRQHFAAAHPGWGLLMVWGTSLITGALFFVTLIIHELAHARVAQHHGIPVRGITLFALGGVSQIEGEPPNAAAEFWLGIIGPITSFIIGGLCLGLARQMGWKAGIEAEAPALAVLIWLGYINIGLASFNMIPGYPLDGGRVLRSLLWWWTGNPVRATRWAERIGHAIALLFIFGGLLEFFWGAGFNGLWLAFIGWFLNDASRHTTDARSLPDRDEENTRRTQHYAHG